MFILFDPLFHNEYLFLDLLFVLNLRTWLWLHIQKELFKAFEAVKKLFGHNQFVEHAPNLTAGLKSISNFNVETIYVSVEVKLYLISIMLEDDLVGLRLHRTLWNMFNEVIYREFDLRHEI